MTLALSLWLYWLSLVVLNKFVKNSSVKTKWVTVLVLTPLVIYPFVYGPVWWLRGLTGDLSITTLLLLSFALYQQLFSQEVLGKREEKLIGPAIVIIGAIFYPLALGVGNFDPYALGYDHHYLVAVVLLLSLAAFVAQFRVMAMMMVGAVLAWNVQLLQSVNLWDYLIDPFVFFFYLGRVIKWKR